MLKAEDYSNLNLFCLLFYDLSRMVGWNIDTLVQNFIDSLFAYFQFPLDDDNSFWVWVPVERIISAPILAHRDKKLCTNKKV